MDGHEPTPLVVIGAGFGRTGTVSMKLALEQLGFGPTHHMLEAFGRPEDFTQWGAAIRGEPWDRDAVLAGFRSTLDFPACLLWRELWQANPGSKVLLTTRSSESWWRSFDATIGPEIRDRRFDDDLAAAGDTFDAIDEVVFGRRTDDRDAAVAAFETHNQSVVDTVPAEELLVFPVGAGWDPLCAFLGVDVPDEPFPSTNTTQEFQAGREEQEAGADQ